LRISGEQVSQSNFKKPRDIFRNFYPNYGIWKKFNNLKIRFSTHELTLIGTQVL